MQATTTLERFLGRLRRAVSGAAWTANAMAVASLAFISAILIYEIVARFGFNRPTGWSDEAAAYFMPGMVFLAAGHTLLHDGHIRVDMLYRRLELRPRRWISLFNESVGLAALVFLVWFSSLMVERVWVSERVATAGTYQFPEYLPRLVVPLGLAVMAFAQALIWLHSVLAIAAPDRFPAGAEGALEALDSPSEHG